MKKTSVRYMGLVALASGLLVSACASGGQQTAEAAERDIEIEAREAAIEAMRAAETGAQEARVSEIRAREAALRAAEMTTRDRITAEARIAELSERVAQAAQIDLSRVEAELAQSRLAFERAREQMASRTPAIRDRAAMSFEAARLAEQMQQVVEVDQVAFAEVRDRMREAEARFEQSRDEMRRTVEIDLREAGRLSDELRARSEEMRAEAQAMVLEAAGARSLQSPEFPDDPADSLYRAAREAMNEGLNRDAARLFSELRSQYPDSRYGPSSLYYEAFARQRIGGEEQMELAAELLGELHEANPDFGDPAELTFFGETAWAPFVGDFEFARSFGPDATFDLAPEVTFGASSFILDSMDFAFPGEAVAWAPRDFDFEANRDFMTAVSFAPSGTFLWPGVSEECRDQMDTPRAQAISALLERDPEGFVESASAADAASDACAFEATARGLMTLSGRSGDASAEARRLLAAMAVDETVPERARLGALQSIRRADREEGNRLLLEAGLRGDLSPQLRMNALGYGLAAASAGELTSVLDDPALEMLHLRALERLSRLGDAESVTTLMDFAEDIENAAELRATVVRLLARSDDPRVTPFLKRLIG